MALRTPRSVDGQRGRACRLEPAPTQRPTRAQLNGRTRAQLNGCEVGELGADGQLGGAPEDRVDVGVDDLDDPAGQLVGGQALGVRGVAELRDRGLDLLEPLAAVREVVVEHAERVVDDRAVAGPDRARPRGPRRARAAGRASRGRRRAGRRGARRRWCRGRAPCRRSAPRRRRAAGTTASRRCGPGVATTRTSSPSTSTTSPSPRPSEPSRYAGSSARTPHPTRSRELDGRLGVVVVVVGEQHDPDVAGGLGDGVEVGRDRRPGVDDDRAAGTGLAQDPGVGAVEGHEVGVGREHARARAPEGPAGPAHRASSRRPRLQQRRERLGHRQRGLVARRRPPRG